MVKDNHNRISWAEVICVVAQEMFPKAQKITIVQDNLAAHKASALYQILPSEQAREIIRRLEIVPTPKHGSWLNVAEIELNLLKRNGLAKRVGSREELEKQAAEYETARNKKEVKINWQFTSKDARIKLKRLYPSIKYLLNTITIWKVHSGQEIKFFSRSWLSRSPRCAPPASACRKPKRGPSPCCRSACRTRASPNGTSAPRR